MKLVIFSSWRASQVNLDTIWYGVIVALAIWGGAAGLAMLWVIFRGTGTYWFTLHIYVCGISAVFLGSLLAGRRVSSRGWLHGLLIGLLLGVLARVVTLELIPRVMSWVSLVRQVLVWCLWGITGGHVGYSLSAMQRRRVYKKALEGLVCLDNKALNR